MIPPVSETTLFSGRLVGQKLQVKKKNKKAAQFLYTVMSRGSQNINSQHFKENIVPILPLNCPTYILGSETSH